jgi:hypothetical protein
VPVVESNSCTDFPAVFDAYRVPEESMARPSALLMSGLAFVGGITEV